MIPLTLYDVIKQHPIIGERLCGELRSLEDVRPIIRHPPDPWPVYESHAVRIRAPSPRTQRTSSTSHRAKGSQLLESTSVSRTQTIRMLPERAWSMVPATVDSERLWPQPPPRAAPSLSVITRLASTR